MLSKVHKGLLIFLETGRGLVTPRLKCLIFISILRFVLEIGW
jgi:hypothetical protein